MYYLLSWNPAEINAQDDSGKTALHIAIKYADKFTDLRPVKELLMKGSERKIQDKNGQRAIDYVDRYVTSAETQKDLRLLLANPRIYCTGVLALCCVRQPLRRQRRSRSTMMLYVGAMFLTFLLLLFAIMPCKIQRLFNAYL